MVEKYDNVLKSFQQKSLGLEWSSEKKCLEAISPLFCACQILLPSKS